MEKFSKVTVENIIKHISYLKIYQLNQGLSKNNNAVVFCQNGVVNQISFRSKTSKILVENILIVHCSVDWLRKFSVCSGQRTCFFLPNNVHSEKLWQVSYSGTIRALYAVNESRCCLCFRQCLQEREATYLLDYLFISLQHELLHIFKIVCLNIPISRYNKR